MKKLVCGIFGTIYYATILKNGLMSDTNRVDVTDDAKQVVMLHLASQNSYKEDGLIQYEYTNNKGEKFRLCGYDPTKYEVVRKTNNNLEC